MSVDTEKYLEFVDGVTSDPSKEVVELYDKVKLL